MGGKILRGDMYYADLSPGVGSEQNGCRPVLVIQNDIGNKFSNTVIVAVITSQKNTKAKLPTHCPIAAQQGIDTDSLVLLEQIRTIDKARLHRHIGALGAEDLRRVDAALAVSVGL